MLVGSCRQPTSAVPIYTQDINHYWEAYDKIIATDDSLAKREYLQTLFLDRATPGLDKLREVRNYTAEEYLANIEAYPKFWASIRENTLRAPELADRIEAGVRDLKRLYPCPKPASIYFGVGAFRTGGTAVDSFVLIGSESTLADSNVVTTEFPKDVRPAREAYFATNPIDNAYTLFVHEFVHTQQEPIPDNLPGRCLYEGVAEFVSCTATGAEPYASVLFGQAHADSVWSVFETEMFSETNTSKWLWSNAPNVFGQRDLGYYVGYAISQRHYERAADKKVAVRELIEMDYTDSDAVDAIIDGSGFLSEPIAQLRANYTADRPIVTSLVRDKNTFTVQFSEPMDIRYRNFNYGPGGESTSIWIDSVVGFQEDKLTFTFITEDLPPGVLREVYLGPGFRDVSGISLQPYLIQVE